MCAPQSGPLTDVHGVIQRRGRKETEVARRIKGESKGERQIQPVICSKCSPHPGTHKEVQSWVEKRRGREEIEATWWR